MKLKNALKRYTKPVITVIPMFIKEFFTWLYRYSSHPEKYSLEKRWIRLRKAFFKLTNRLKMEIIPEGLENIPETENVCFMINHIGDLDPIAVSTVLDFPTAFVGKIEILKQPFVARAMKSMRSAFIRRSDLKQTLKQMKYVEQQMEEERKNWIIFPEGTRRKDSRLLMADFHAGTFRTPMKAGVTIVPVAILGTERVLQIDHVYKKYPVHIKFLKPITKEMYEGKKTEIIGNLCRDEIQRAISFDLRRKDHLKMLEYNKNYKAI